MTSGSWRGPAVRVLVALTFVVFGFLYRFNTLGERFGGFDNDEFATLTRVNLLLAGEQPLRDFADGELRAVWPSLTYEVPALAQRLWGRSLLVHASLTLGALALCAGVVFLLAYDLSRRVLVAALAATLVIASMPNPYNYPKVLVLTVGVALLRWTIPRPTTARLATLAAWTVIAALFRHDYAVPVALAAVVGIVSSEPRPWIVPARRLGIFVGAGALLSLPSVVWIVRYAGVGRYVREVLASIAVESQARWLSSWPVVSAGAPFDEHSVVAFNYYAFWLMALAGLVVMAVVSFSRNRRPAGVRELGVALVAMTLVVNYFFLRSNLPARFGDAVAPTVLLGAWITGAAPTFTSWTGRGLAHGGPPLLMALMAVAFVRASNMLSQMRLGGLTSTAGVITQFREVSTRLMSLPPAHWSVKEQTGTLAAARYLAECTGPDDRVLLGAYADEIPYFARRHFAGGQAYFAFGFLRGEADQRLALERLGRQSVPIVLTAFDYYREFADDYPLVAQYVRSRYEEVGVIGVAGDRLQLRVFVESSRMPHGTDPVLGFPCFR